MSAELEMKGYWTTRDKQVIHVSEMTDTHLINVAKMLIRITKHMASEANDDVKCLAFGYWEFFHRMPICEHIDMELNKRHIFVEDWISRENWE